jgi:DNA-binding MarR family transcriptional regulator
MQRAYGPLLRPFDLTYLQYLVLLVLWEADDRIVGEIGQRLYLDSGTLTPVLRRLEGLGLVERRRWADDERVVRVTLTARGVELEAEMDALRRAIAAKAGLDCAAFATLRDELRALRGRLCAG